MAITLSAICSTLSAQEKSIEVSLNVENVNGEEQRNFVITIGEGNSEKEISWKDNGVIPAEIKEQLQKEGVDIKMLEGDGQVEITVESDNETETKKEIEIIKIQSENDEGHHKQDREIRIDEDGDIMIIKLKKGEDLPDDVKKILEEHDIDIEELKKEGLHESHDRDLKKEHRSIKIKTKDGDGNESIIEWNSDGGDIPDNIQKLLDEEGIELDNEGEHKMIFIGEDSDFKEIKINKESKKLYRIKTIDDDGNEKVIEWNGEGEMPAKMKKHQKLFKKEKKVIEKKSSNRAQLGVMVEETDEGKGVRVIDVIKNTPASASGFKKGYIITAVDGTDVNKIDELLAVLKQYKPGDVAKIEFVSNNKTEVTKVTLGDAAYISSGENQSPNIFIFQNAISGGEFDMFKKVEKCDESGSNTKTVKIIKQIKEETTEENVSKAIDERIIPADRHLDLKSFSVFPNPTAGNLNISFTGNNEPTVVQVTDITGKEVFKETINNFNGSYNKDIDLSNYAKGQFILYVIQNQKIFTESIILQ